MNAVVVLNIAFVVAVVGYRGYARYIDKYVMKADPKRVTPANMYMDGVEFMPTSKNVLFGYQFKSIAGAAPVLGPIIAIKWGWLPGLLWIWFGNIFLGAILDYLALAASVRYDGRAADVVDGGSPERVLPPQLPRTVRQPAPVPARQCQRRAWVRESPQETAPEAAQARARLRPMEQQ